MAEAKTEAKAKAGRQGQMHEQDLHAIDRLETELRQAKKDLQKRGFEIGPAPPKCPPPGDIPRFLIGWMQRVLPLSRSG